MMQYNSHPRLAQRHLELQSLGWPESSLKYIRGRELRFSFMVAPTRMSRVYRCLLRVYVAKYPELFVIDPDPKTLAAGRKLPHIYPHEGAGAKLCLWLPRAGEWSAKMRLSETYLPWAAEWLDYFEEWLVTNEWTGGGAHPEVRKKRWAITQTQMTVR
jgi:hypothetical protein